MESGDQEQQQAGQPAFNVPKIVAAFIALCCVVHIYRFYWIDLNENFQLVLTYAFIPARFDEALAANYEPLLFREGFSFSTGLALKVWTFITYTFLHGDLLHLTVNSLWLLVFGSALARRFGVFRFILISAIGSVGGALLHLYFHWGEFVPMVGASAAISAHMACASRFAFVPYGPLGRPRSNHPGSYFLPSLSFLEVLKNAQAMTFVGVWFALNLLFGLGGNILADEGGASIAWLAHLGGFVAGFLLFPLLDPAKNLNHIQSQ